MSSLDTLGSNPYSHDELHASSYSLVDATGNSSSNSCSDRKEGKQLVQGLKEITGSKSTYDFGSKFTTESTKSIHRLTNSVAGLDDSNISLLNSTSDHACSHANDFVQGRRASCNNPAIPTTSKWHKFTNTSNNTNTPTLASFSTSDLNHLL